jgi:pilus assembly protein CpaC
MPNFRSRRDAGDRLLPPWPHLILAALVIAAWPDDPLRAQVPPPPAPAPPQPAPAPLASQPLPVAAPLEGQPLPVAPRFSDESEIPPTLPRVPLAPPLPAQGPSSVGSLIESLRGNDATFEVLVNQARILTLKQDMTAGRTKPLIAVGDPSIVEFAVVSPKQLRVTGLRIGVTDLAITTARNETYIFEIHVVRSPFDPRAKSLLEDLTLIQGKLRSTFPDASIKLSQLRDLIVVEGEARDQAQIARILETLRVYLKALGGAAPGTGGPAGGQAPGAGGEQTPPPPAVPAQPGAEAPENQNPAAAATLSPELSGMTQVSGAIAPHQIINLLRVVGSQQVMLKVRIAELNRTAMRRIGANFLGVDTHTGAIVGSSIAGPTAYQGTIGQPGNLLFGNQLYGSSSLGPNDGNSTVFGIFQHNNFEFSLTALRQNGLLKILAEPNLVALNGQLASFLAGGEFPVPVPQVSASGVAPTITVRFREFGVRLGFVPYILDGDVIRLTVAPEVSNIDPTIAVTLVAGGSPVPGLNTRKALTTVELREGQTLAIAGLLQLTLNGETDRIPGLGDLPILGPFFSNTSSQRIEKELVVLVTPYLIEPMSHGQVPPTPGDEVKQPNDLEFFFLNRIEARTGKDFRATTSWDDVYNLRHHLKLEKKYVNGPVGFSE